MCIRSQTNLSRVDKIWRSGFNPKVPRLTLVYLPVQMWILWFWHLEMLNLDFPVKCMGPGFSSGCWMWQAPPSSPYSQKPDKQIKSNKTISNYTSILSTWIISDFWISKDALIYWFRSAYFHSINRYWWWVNMQIS